MPTYSNPNEVAQHDDKWQNAYEGRLITDQHSDRKEKADNVKNGKPEKQRIVRSKEIGKDQPEAQSACAAKAMVLNWLSRKHSQFERRRQCRLGAQINLGQIGRNRERGRLNHHGQLVAPGNEFESGN